MTFPSPPVPRPTRFSHADRICPVVPRLGSARRAGTFGRDPKGGDAPWVAGLSVDEAIAKLAREGRLSDVKVSFNSFDRMVQAQVMRGNDTGAVERIERFVRERDAVEEAGGERFTITLQLTFMCAHAPPAAAGRRRRTHPAQRPLLAQFATGST